MPTISTIIISACTLASALARGIPPAMQKRAPAPFSNFVNNVVYEPGPEYNGMRTLYAHTLQLEDESLIMTWENYREEPPQDNFLVYRSTDGGATWSPYSTIEDTVNGWGLRWHPHFYALPESFASLPAGTILAGGTSIPSDLSKTWIDVYTSTDQALNWQFASHVAYGDGPAPVNSGSADAVWEPFFLLHDGVLICYYSDETDDQHSQKLVYRTTTDLRSWSEPVDLIKDDFYDGRPGMAVVSHIEAIDKWIVTFEHCQPNVAGCPAEYRIADSPLGFASSPNLPLRSNDTEAIQPAGGPYNMWIANPTNPNGPGLILANAASDNHVFVNELGGDEGGWKLVDVGQDASYSRTLRKVTLQGRTKILIGASGLIFGQNNRPTAGIVEVPS